MEEDDQNEEQITRELSKILEGKRAGQTDMEIESRKTEMAEARACQESSMSNMDTNVSRKECLQGRSGM